MERQRTQSHSEQKLEAEFRERDTADTPEGSTTIEIYNAGPDPPPGSLQPDQPPASTSSALSRYLQVSRDPTAAMAAFEDPRTDG